MLTPQDETKLLGRVVEKLMRETMNLRRDVRSLLSHIDPTQAIDADPKMWRFDKPIVTATEAFAAIDSARRNIRDAERELFAARSKIELMAGAVLPRDESKRPIIGPSQKRQDR